MKLKDYGDPISPRNEWTGRRVNWHNVPKFKYIKDSMGEYTPVKKCKIKRTIYFTNHPKILKKLELFAKENKISLSATILGFCAMGLMVDDLPWGVKQLRSDTKAIRGWGRV